MKVTEEKRYEQLSPFELKNKLIKIAKSHHERVMINEGRGNPNWVAITPRQGFFLLGQFAIQESLRVVDIPAVGGPCEKKGISARFKSFLSANKSTPGADFLKKVFTFVCDEMKLDSDDFIQEMTDAMLGDHYPEPDRILKNVEKIIQKYLDQEMFASNPPKGTLDLFATEGGTAAMDYIFSTLMENKLLFKGDKIAIGTPIFTPYIEIPKLNDYEFIELEIKQDENNDWQYPDTEIDKLKDPKVKAFFIVNPSNPTSVAMNKHTLKRIKDLVDNERKDLIIITDDVYGTFVNEFKSIAWAAPLNTILVYSYSKYFGATGWRLGVIGLNEHNVFDKKIAAFSAKDKKALHKRYETVALNPEKMKLIERMVADSRSVALHHTAGLSTPQQVLMTLFSLYCLTDKEGKYKKMAQYVVMHRFKSLYSALGVKHPDNKYDAHYYTTIDIPKIAEERYGKDFAKHLVKNFEPIDFVIKLAERKSVVLMDGGGFDAPNMSIRVSLANLPNATYDAIGKGISDLLEEYHKHWKVSKK